MSGLETLFARLTGKQFPTNLAPKRATGTIVTTKFDLKRMGLTVLGITAVGALAATAAAVGGMVGETNSMRGLLALAERAPVQPTIPSNVSFGQGVAPARQTALLNDLQEVARLCAKHGVPDLPKVKKIELVLFGEEDTAVSSQVAAYNLQTDHMKIDAVWAWTTQAGYRPYLVHELGHRFQGRTGGRVPRGERFNIDYHITALFEAAKQNSNKFFVTPYASTDPQEFWAESFRFYIMNENNMRSRHPELYSWVDLMVKTFDPVVQYA